MPPALEKWLNEATTKRSEKKKVKAVIVKELDDASGDAHEWLELRNLTDNELNLKGWTVDMATTNELNLEGWTLADGVIIKEGDDASGDAHEWLELPDNELNLKGWTVDMATTHLVTTKLDTEGKLIPTLFFNKDVKIPAGGVLRVPYPESLEKLGIIIVTEYEYPHKGKKERGQTMKKDDARERERTLSREELVKRFDKDGDGKLNREEGMAARRALANRASQNRNRRENVEVKNPTEFKKVQGATLFSGPQPGEKLPPLMATGIRGGAKGKTFDFIAKADDGKPLVLFLQDGSGVGLRGLYDIFSMVEKISNKSKQELQMSAVFLGDDPAALKQITQHVPKNVLVGISPEGREGPGNYGLNRNVAQTVIIAKDGKVLHNFAFAQPLLYADPHVIGAIAQTIGEDPSTVEKWLNEKPAEDARPKPDKKQMEDISDQTEELLKQLNTFQERLQRINETVAKTKGKEDTLDQVKALLEQLNADLKILQREKESIFAAKTEGKEDRLDQVEALVKKLNRESGSIARPTRLK